MEYRIAVQCKDAETSRIATFIRNQDNIAVSLLFNDLSELFPWMRKNGWKSNEYVNGTFKPWRVTKE